MIRHIKAKKCKYNTHICNTQPCGDSKGTQSFFKSGTGGRTRGFDVITVIYEYVLGSELGIGGWEGTHSSRDDIATLVNGTPVKFIHLKVRIAAADLAFKESGTPRPTFVTKMMPEYFEPKIERIDERVREYKMTRAFPDNKALKKFRMDCANDLRIGVYALRDASLYQMFVVGPLHIQLRLGDKWPLIWSIWRKLFRVNPNAAITVLGSKLPIEAKKFIARAEALSMNKSVPQSYNGEKVNILLGMSQQICEATAQSIKSDDEQWAFKKFINALSAYLFERCGRFVEYMYADLNADLYHTSSDHWDHIFERGLQTLRTLNEKAPWLITPTIVRLFSSMPHANFSMAVFNEKHGTSYTIRDFDENRMELFNKDIKTFVKRHQMRAKGADVGFVSAFEHIVIVHHGGLDEKEWDLSHTPHQIEQMTRPKLSSTFDLSNFDPQSVEMIEALRNGKDIPYVDDSEIASQMRKTAAFVKAYRDSMESDVVGIVIEVESDESNVQNEMKEPESLDAVAECAVPRKQGKKRKRQGNENVGESAAKRARKAGGKKAGGRKPRRALLSESE